MPRVLLIDDETQVANSLIRLLELAGARSVDWAQSATTALSLASASPFDIIVSDFDLGPKDLTGVAIMADLRALYPSTVMVCISSAPRAVPTWCTFVDKANADELASVVRSWH